MNTTNALRQTDRQSTLVMDAKCSSLHKYAPPSWCFLGSVDRVAYLFGLPVDVTGPRGSVTWLRSASAASRRLSRRFFGADAAAWFAGVLLCATQVVQPVQPAVACGCVRLRAVGTGLVLSGCVWLGRGFLIPGLASAREVKSINQSTFSCKRPIFCKKPRKESASNVGPQSSLRKTNPPVLESHLS